jgi:D-3-phosphoglycerate dehydrogenase
MAQILITAEFFGELGKEALNLIAAAGFSYEIRSDIETELRGKEDIFCSLIENVEALIVSGKAKITRKVIEAATRLRVISRRGVGFDNIDVAFAKEKGIMVATTPHVVAATVADHTMMLILGLAKRITSLDRSVREGHWVRNRWSVELAEKTLGIIGLGRIGKMVARRARAFEMKVLAYDPTIDNGFVRENGITPLTLNGLLGESDFVTLHLPLSEHTHGLIGANELSLMKPTAFLINTSRGALIDEKALVEALKNEKIAGAGLDVFESEPLPNKSPLKFINNTLLTPHTAGNTPECWLAMEKAAAQNAIAVLRGNTPEYLI